MDVREFAALAKENKNKVWEFTVIDLGTGEELVRTKSKVVFKNTVAEFLSGKLEDIEDEVFVEYYGAEEDGYYEMEVYYVDDQIADIIYHKNFEEHGLTVKEELVDL